MAGQQILDLLIGVRVPGGQPNLRRSVKLHENSGPCLLRKRLSKISRYIAKEAMNRNFRYAMADHRIHGLTQGAKRRFVMAQAVQLGLMWGIAPARLPILLLTERRQGRPFAMRRVHARKDGSLNHSCEFRAVFCSLCSFRTGFPAFLLSFSRNLRYTTR